MHLNWLYFCGICQLIPLKLWPNTVQGCNHQSTCMPQPVTTFMFSCSATNVLPQRDEGLGKPPVVPVQWSKPYSILTSTQDSKRAAGFKIINSDHYTTSAHSAEETINNNNNNNNKFSLLRSRDSTHGQNKIHNLHTKQIYNIRGIQL